MTTPPPPAPAPAPAQASWNYAPPQPAAPPQPPTAAPSAWNYPPPQPAAPPQPPTAAPSAWNYPPPQPANAYPPPPPSSGGRSSGPGKTIAAVAAGLIIAVVGVFLLAVFVGGTDSNSDKPRAESTATTLPAAAPKGPSLEPVLAPVAGLTFVDLPPDTIAAIADAAANYPGVPEGAYAGVAGKTVLRAGTPVAIIVAFSVDDRYSKLPGFEKEVLSGFPKSERVKIGSQTVTYVPDVGGAQEYIFYRNGVLLVIGGTRDYSRADLELVMGKVLPNMP